MGEPAGVDGAQHGEPGRRPVHLGDRDRPAEIKEALMDGLGRPATVPQSQRLGRAAVLAMLRVARRCRGAVPDSTWFDHTLPYVRSAPARS